MLPEQYPFKSPSIGFVNKVFHPNIDEGSGTVCLDVINQTWSPMFDLVNIFDVFLPQLLLYPNPKDPLNPEAAQKFINDEVRYKDTVRDYTRKYANEEYLKETCKEFLDREGSGKKGETDKVEAAAEEGEGSELSETSEVAIIEEGED